MAKPEIVDVHVDNMNHDFTKCALGCTRGTSRYHVWMNPTTFEIEGPLYQNSTAEFRKPGYFGTRSHDVDSKNARPIVEAMMEVANREGLFAKARAAEVERQGQAARDLYVRTLENRANDLALPMFGVLVELIHGIVSGHERGSADSLQWQIDRARAILDRIGSPQDVIALASIKLPEVCS